MNPLNTAVQFGKVRINTSINSSQRILTATNRISAFDCVLPFEIEDKGQILQAISVYFFTSTRDIIQNHFLGCLDAHSMLVRSGQVLPLEVIARGTLTGSLWKSYNKGGPQEVLEHWGIELPADLKQHHRFSSPLITFTTKAAHGHDLLVNYSQATAHVKKWLEQNKICEHSDCASFAEQLMRKVSDCAQQLFQRGEKVCAESNILLMDTKYEFALDSENQLMLVDEIHTPDASRFVDLKAFENSKIEHLSKEWLREEVQNELQKESLETKIKERSKAFVLRSFWNKKEFKTHLADGLKLKYFELFNRLFPGMKPWDVIAPHLVPWPVDPMAMRRVEAQQRLPSRVLVVGNGGRDYTLATLLERQPDVDVVYAWPGRESWNGGKKHALGNIQLNELLRFCELESIGWAIFGPEMPIAQGFAEKLRESGVFCLAPDLEGARLEVSKIHTKNILNKAGCPTAEAWVLGWNELKSAATAHSKSPMSSVLDQYPYVLKYESLAAGKGVCLVHNESERTQAIRHFETNLPAWLEELHSLPVTTDTKEKGEPQFLVEKLLPGKEISAIALCHGENYVLLPYAQDFKRRNNDQKGPNTGGMGAVCPVALPNHLEIQIQDIFQRTLKTLKDTGTEYRGFLFAGLMLDEHHNAHVLEFNCRMGDPETQVILPGLGRDLVLAMWLTSKNEPWSANPWLLKDEPHKVKHDELKRCFVVLASPEYPDGAAPLRTLAIPDEWPAHTEWIPSSVDADHTTKAGRIAGILATEESEKSAIESAYRAAQKITFLNDKDQKPHYRTDIAFPNLRND